MTETKLGDGLYEMNAIVRVRDDFEQADPEWAGMTGRIIGYESMAETHNIPELTPDDDIPWRVEFPGSRLSHFAPHEIELWSDYIIRTLIAPTHDLTPEELATVKRFGIHPELNGTEAEGR